MKYALGFDANSDAVLVDSFEDLKCVNCNCFLYANENEAAQSLRNTLIRIEEKFGDDDTIVTSNEIISQNIRHALEDGFSFNLRDYDRINFLITKYILHFLKLEVNKQDYWPLGSGGTKPTDDPLATGLQANKWQKKFYGRYGNVELRVIDNYIRDASKLNQELYFIKNTLSDEDFMYAPQSRSRKHWLDAGDICFNLRKLMTNAGYYPSASLQDVSLEKWCQLYFESLLHADYLFPFPGAYPNFWVVQDHLFHLGKPVSYASFLAPDSFYRSLELEDVLFVTPFADEIAEIVANGNIRKLYTDIDIPNFSLRTVKAEITTYPNRPHDSWYDTFERLISSVSKAFQEKPPTLFFASCGCYGMPLCHYVYKTFGCAAVYYGNHMNTLFGVRQACSENFLPNRRLLENWAVAHLDDVPNVHLIDSGRYVFNKND